eukprot:4066006-Amphidinium_carterae.1
MAASSSQPCRVVSSKPHTLFISEAKKPNLFFHKKRNQQTTRNLETLSTAGVPIPVPVRPQPPNAASTFCNQ